MLQPISYNNFKGHLAIKAARGTVDDIKAIIPEEERIIFDEALDTFQKRVEDETSDKANFVLTLSNDIWEAGDTMPCGEGITFDLHDAQREFSPRYKKVFPIIRPNGKLWDSGEKFKKSIEIFLNKLGDTAISSRNLSDARDRAAKRKYN